MSGKTVGVFDLTCRRGHADSLMISLARSTADQLSQALAETSGGRNMRLLQEYARTCRHTGGIVLALGNDVVMLNDHARQALSPADQAELISQATEALGRHSSGAVTVDLPGGVVARMFCHPLLPADGVFHVKLVAPAAAAVRTGGRPGRCRCPALSARARSGGVPAGRRRRATSAASG